MSTNPAHDGDFTRVSAVTEADAGTRIVVAVGSIEIAVFNADEEFLPSRTGVPTSRPRCISRARRRSTPRTPGPRLGVGSPRRRVRSPARGTAGSGISNPVSGTRIATFDCAVEDGEVYVAAPG
jgi:nitrite reductase/ring-hydroxylating ferredoxin subunit